MIRVGVAGWDYPDWNGRVYPRRCGRGFDRLAYIAHYVDLVEVNSTFYRPVAPHVSESWVQRTRERPRFTFTAKAHRSWTHDAEPEFDSVVPATLKVLRPLLEAGRLGALLLQFPQSFHFGQAARSRIERLLDRVADWPVVIEVRHVSWKPEAVAAWFRRHGLGWCLVDQPRVGSSTLEPIARVTSDVAYMRLHGRNRRDWFRPDAGRDARYDYLYTRRQLEELARNAHEMAAQAEELFVVQNNHFRGQALVNTLQLRHLVEGQPPEAPEELVDAFPVLAAEVRLRPTRLF